MLAEVSPAPLSEDWLGTVCGGERARGDVCVLGAFLARVHWRSAASPESAFRHRSSLTLVSPPNLAGRLILPSGEDREWPRTCRALETVASGIDAISRDGDIIEILECPRIIEIFECPRISRNRLLSPSSCHIRIYRQREWFTTICVPHSVSGGSVGSRSHIHSGVTRRLHQKEDLMAVRGKTILVNGANRGIGRALVEKGLRKGAEQVYAGTFRPSMHPDVRVTPLRLDVADATEIVESVDILAPTESRGAWGTSSDPHAWTRVAARYLVTKSTATAALITRQSVISWRTYDEPPAR